MNPVPWETRLYSRCGATTRMCGIQIFHDFAWRDVFPDERAQFRGGKCLAQLVKKTCPDGYTPVLLLTRKPDAPQGNRISDKYYLTIVNIDQYLEKAAGDAATTYFAMLMPADVISAANIDWSRLSDTDVKTVLDRHINLDFLQAWLNADAERVNILVRLLSECKADPNTLVCGREHEIAAILHQKIGDQFWIDIQNAGAELPAALAHKRLWSIRNEQVEEFNMRLRQSDWSESDWQDFFENNTWIFGYGLSYRFLHVIETKPSLGGKAITRKGSQEGDYLLSTEAETKFTVLVEIKRPDADLVSNNLYRNRTYELGPDLTGGVAQLQQQCWRWAVEGARSDENRDILESQGIFTHEPKGILVIGDTASIKNNRDKMRTLESFRRNLHNPEIITFDELLHRARKAVQSYADNAITQEERP